MENFWNVLGIVLFVTYCLGIIFHLLFYYLVAFALLNPNGGNRTPEFKNLLKLIRNALLWPLIFVVNYFGLNRKG